MFERPQKKDIDHALSNLMHEARRQTLDEKNRIFSEAILAGALQSSRVVVIVADAADKIHAATMKRAGQTLRDFIERMEIPATEIAAWSRPHLENLSNSVLAVIPPNGFPTDHQRITNQYQAIFQQRVDSSLRDVEIGYVKGAGFSTRATMSEKEEWIGAAAALALLGMRHNVATRTICKRAHAGLIKARAARFIRNGRPLDNIDIPSEFWWAQGEAALIQNWVTGDFETWIDRRVRLEAFGVTFRRSDIEILIANVPTPLETLTPETALHLERVDQRNLIMASPGKTIFIGHGRAANWRELKDFLKERLHLSVDEFNSVPVAGITTVSRLKEMLDKATFAFLIMTAEDEQLDGTFRARENVIHEAGLFQGRLGFEKAIILLEEGCEEFSNIHGLNQIRFPKNKISSVFEEIRQVLEREGLSPQQ